MRFVNYTILSDIVYNIMFVANLRVRRLQYTRACVVRTYRLGDAEATI